MSYTGQVQNLDWVSPSRIFATTVDLLNSQPNYEHEVAIAEGIKYQGIAPVVGGWRYATGAAGPYPPTPDPPAVNDGFTKVLLEFEGIEGSTTYSDTNAAVWPRTWRTQGFAGFGGVTNVNERIGEGALKLDGKTVITAPDAVNFVFTNSDFTVRGYFLCDFPLGVSRILTSKTDGIGVRRMFWIERFDDGRMSAGIQTIRVLEEFALVDRFDEAVVDRFGQAIIIGGTTFTYVLLDTVTVYSDTVNLGWHEFKFARTGDALSLHVDGVLEDSLLMTTGTVANSVFGPITIAGYGPPRDGVYQGNPWVGGLDRFAIDIGIAR